MRITLLMLCVMLLSGLAAAQPTYTGAYGAAPHCQGCHSGALPPTNQYPLWHQTAHSGAYDNHPAVQWNANCLPCHTTGWDAALNNGGFDDYFYTGDTLGMVQMRNVQCEACHGPTSQFPHPTTTAVDYHAEVCGGCHTGMGRPTYDEWASCRHGQLAAVGTQQLACAKCHEAASAANFITTGNPPQSLPVNPVWQVACAACHAAHAANTFGPQLRLNSESLCRTCHSMEGATVGEVPHSPQKEMVLGIGFGGFEWPGYVYNNSCHETYLPFPCTMCHMYTNTYGYSDTTTTGHQMTPRIQLCATLGCHYMQIPPDSSFNINNCQTEVDSLLGVLAAALAQADSTTIQYAQAKFDYDFVLHDGSRGVHNFFYARGLLESSLMGLAGMPIVTITMTPVNPPIRIPAAGGSFNFNAAIYNGEATPQTFDVWIMIQLPNSSWWGPALGPVILTLPANFTLIRVRTQNIPGYAPAGNYLYEGRVGDYPGTIWHVSSFEFTKLSTGRDSRAADDWANTGEEFAAANAISGAPAAAISLSNRPNPFNPATAISYELRAASFVSLRVYDTAGKLVTTLVDGYREAGAYQATFDGSGLPSGVYLYHLTAGGASATGKMLLVK